jgi:hypothetical protein
MSHFLHFQEKGKKFFTFNGNTLKSKKARSVEQAFT